VRESETATLERPKMGGRAEHGTIQALPLTGPLIQNAAAVRARGLGVTEAPTHKDRQWPKSLSQPPIRRQAASEATHRARATGVIPPDRTASRAGPPLAPRGGAVHIEDVAASLRGVPQAVA
jgi:hypothetical protein